MNPIERQRCFADNPDVVLAFGLLIQAFLREPGPGGVPACRDCSRELGEATVFQLHRCFRALYAVLTEINTLLLQAPDRGD